MQVAVTGAGGFIGRALVAALLARGDSVIALGRNPQTLRFPGGVECRRFEPSDPVPQPAAFDGVDAVVHLAGETVAGRWTDEKKRAIRASRVAGTQHLVASLEARTARPHVLVSSSAAGYYGSRGDEPLFETSAPGRDFLARVCVDWEAAAADATRLGIRTAWLRTGIVLGSGGALAAMAQPFRLGLGGPLGSGRQFVPWIHLDDLVALYLLALDRDLEGPLNAVAPDYATSARFAQAIGAALRRPSLLPAPAFALRAALGEFATSVLASTLVVPARAQDARFEWRRPLLEGAVADALTSAAAPPYGISVFESVQHVKASREDVFAFFSSPHNLEQITPPTLRFTITSSPDRLERGSLISYRLRLRGLPLRWDTLIAAWEPPERFVDVQLHGPYALWEHEHLFLDVPDGVEIVDRVRYLVPFAPLGNAALPFVRADVGRIFAYRRRIIAERFPA